jgi:cob(I)alamin adenosyltransferase
MHIEESKVKEMEAVIHTIEKQLPPIKTFFISGGTELAATFDFARTLARRAERRVVAVHEENKVKLHKDTLAYMNRLSSVLYALARLTNHKSGITEEPPSYE